MMSKHKLLSLAALAVTLSGILLLAGSILGGFISTVTLETIGSRQVWGITIGFALAFVGYLFHKRVTGDLTLDGVPRITLTVGIFFALTIELIVIVDLLGFHEKKIVPLRGTEERLVALEAMVHRTGRTPTNCLRPSTYLIPPVQVESVVGGLDTPVYVTHAKDGSGQLFVVEQAGRIQIVKEGKLLPQPFLDISEHVISPRSDPPGGTEQGLLSVAFHPNYQENGRFFVNYTAIEDGRTIVEEYQRAGELSVPNPMSERVILEVAQPNHAHNGGLIQFGPDGFLYIGLGDGGGQNQKSAKNAQDLGSLLGKILRIDVNKEAPYVVPPDNPFVGQNGIRSEIFAYGFRNPWRFSFDRCEGSLYLADVGAFNWEEVNFVRKGGNYGWPVLEGAHCLFPKNTFYWCDKTRFQFPITEYGHLDRDPTGGMAIIGGYVYRGKRFPQLAGYYFLSDWISRRLWVLIETEANPNRWERREVLQLDFMPTSFGEGEDGELYLTGYNGTLYRLEQASGSFY